MHTTVLLILILPLALAAFNGLKNGITCGSINLKDLEILELKNCCLPSLNFECFAGTETP